MSDRDPPGGPSERSSRRRFLLSSLLGGIAVTSDPRAAPAAAPQPATKVKPFDLDEATIEDLHKSGLTARQLAQRYLDRIHAIDRNGPGLNSVIEINPDALKIAQVCDRQRKAWKKGDEPLGPLHGIPVLLKENVDTADRMATTAGSLALAEAAPPAKDAFLVERLRKAGAVIIGKTNLSEWAEMRSSYSTSGWSGRGGLTRNPYALDRNPAGSSSGSAVAVSANLCAVAVGTETSSSIVRPASVNGVVGIKPTVGLISRIGLVPLAHSQDTPGPMARTVRDAVLLLNVLAAPDENDKIPLSRPKESVKDYAVHLKANGLKGKRIGVVRNFCGIHEAVDALMEKAIEVMKSKEVGAEVYDVNLPVELETPAQWFGTELTVLYYEFKADLNAYLKTRQSREDGPAIVGSLKELIEYNEKRRDVEMPYFGQDLFVSAEAKGSLKEKEYLVALEKNWKLAREKGIDAVMKAEKKRPALDALVAPTEGPAWLTNLVGGDHFRTKSTSAAAIAGYPSISLPMGHVFGLPVGISFFGTAWSEPVLIECAHAFEQATIHRAKPRFLATANLSG